MRLYPTRPYGGVSRGYTIGAFDPLRLRDHHRLASGCLALHTHFGRVYEIRELPDRASAHWERLVSEHDALIRQRADQQPVAEKRTTEHEKFLDRIDEMINADERVALATRSDPFPIAAIKPVGEQRKGVYPMYKFVLAGNDIPAGMRSFACVVRPRCVAESSRSGVDR